MIDGGSQNDDRRTYDDDHTKQIVRLTVNEIFDGVGVDFSTSGGRQRFRNLVMFADDALAGTQLVKKTAGMAMITTFITGAAFGLWTMFLWIASLGKPHGGS